MEEVDEKKEAPREHAIIERIAKLRNAVAEMEHRLSQMKAELVLKKNELSNFEEAARMVYGPAEYEMMLGSFRNIPGLLPGMRWADGELQSTFLLRNEATGVLRKRRTLSKSWATILEALSGLESFGYDQIMKLDALHGFGISIQSARTQMSAYIDAGLVNRLEDGEFSVTLDGSGAAKDALAKYAHREAKGDPNSV